MTVKNWNFSIYNRKCSFVLLSFFFFFLQSVVNVQLNFLSLMEKGVSLVLPT